MTANDGARADELREVRAEDSGDPLACMFDGAWLDTQEFPPLEYAVPGIIPEGFGLLVSPPKAGKSWLVCCIGLACAAGGLALGRIRVRQRSVLYLALEDGQRRLQSRSRRIMRGQPIPAAVHFITKAKPVEVVPMIGEFLARHAGEMPLVILDTLGKARPCRPAGADLYAWDYAVGTGLKDVIDTAPGATLLVVHHTRKQESSDFVDSVSGSQGVAGSADFVLVLSRKRHSDDALLSVTGRDITEGEYALRVSDGLWELDGADLQAASEVSETRRLSDTRSAQSLEIFGAVVQCPEPVSVSAVSGKLGLDAETVGRYLRRLAADGHIVRVGRGLYRSVSGVSGVSGTIETDTPDTPDTLFQLAADEATHTGDGASNRTRENPASLFAGDGQSTPPGGITDSTPGATERVRKALVTASKPRCPCGAELILEESIKSGRCMECWHAGKAR